MWQHQKWECSDPCVKKLKNTLSSLIYLFENIHLVIYWMCNKSRLIRKIIFVSKKYSNFFPRWNQQSFTWIRCWGPPSSGRIWNRLLQKKQIWKSRFSYCPAKSSKALPNFWNFFHMFFWPQCTFGTKNPQNPNTGTPSKLVLFSKSGPWLYHYIYSKQPKLSILMSWILNPARLRRWLITIPALGQ